MTAAPRLRRAACWRSPWARHHPTSVWVPSSWLLRARSSQVASDTFLNLSAGTSQSGRDRARWYLECLSDFGRIQALDFEQDDDRSEVGCELAQDPVEQLSGAPLIHHLVCQWSCILAVH